MEPTSDGVELGPGARVSPSELSFRATRSGGPGGQHVNTSATRVELTWDIASSPSLEDEVRARLLDRLASRLHGDGVLRVVASRSRSQHRNREAALDRLRALVAEALEERKKRRRTRPSKAAAERRIAAKKRRAERKRQRRPPVTDD
ncbi:MAG TPA: alternative ribosome rescue aminoacyl-tRNA hydrolase ArfB [Longimicrobiales bacterium]|nr:alternative ribosome rescue aminoacyl-tRNA hydrolase ArfB [Longimicrobiales bacterium]